MLDCLCTGILVADHVCSPIPHLPAAGELVLADELPLAIGGCASNVAMNLARLGLQAGIVGCVGQDVLGEFVRQTLESAGVATHGIRRIAEAGTSGTLIINVAGQDRRFVHSIGANGVFRASDIPLEQVRQAKVLYVGGYLLMTNCRQDELLEVFREARRAGVKTVLDVVLPGPGDHWSRLDRVLSETDVFLPNTDEAAIICGEKDPLGQAQKFAQAGAGTVVITCGGDGVVLVSGDRRVKSSVYPVQFVGGTGAGDAFDAGYIAGLLAGHDEAGCLKWGSALGASCVRGIGATETVFTRDEALDFMSRHVLPFEDLA